MLSPHRLLTPPHCHQIYHSHSFSLIILYIVKRKIKWQKCFGGKKKKILQHLGFQSAFQGFSEAEGYIQTGSWVMLKWPSWSKGCHPSESPEEGVTRLPVPQGTAPQFLHSRAAAPRPLFPAGTSATEALFCRSEEHRASAPDLAGATEDGLGIFIASRRYCEPWEKQVMFTETVAITNTGTSL